MQRGGEECVLKGDKNTNYFHMKANGKRRKTTITTMENEGSE